MCRKAETPSGTPVFIEQSPPVEHTPTQSLTVEYSQTTNQADSEGICRNSSGSPKIFQRFCSMHDAPFHLKRLPNLARVVFVGMVEWLRRQPRKLLPFGRMGSNPISDVHFFFFPTSSPFCFRLIPHLLAGFSVIFRSFFAIPDLFTARFHLIGKRAFLWYRTCVACIRGVCM